jgi:hypothetical protein
LGVFLQSQEPSIHLFKMAAWLAVLRYGLAMCPGKAAILIGKSKNGSGPAITDFPESAPAGDARHFETRSGAVFATAVSTGWPSVRFQSAPQTDLKGAAFSIFYARAPASAQ